MSYHVLLVDDDSYFRSEFKEFMEEFDIIEAAGGREALNILHKPHNIDLIILDEHMPEIKGTQLLEQIHALYPNMPAIILTGYGSKETAIDAVRGHAADYIEKPLTSAKIAKIKNFILSVPRGEKDKSVSGIKGKIEQVKYFVQRNYSKKLTLDDVADEVCLSSKYLSRVFKQQTGMTFLDYKLSLRIEKAKELLKESGDNIEEIAFKLGYQNPESLGRIFKHFTQMSPREYRDQEKNKIQQETENSGKARQKTAEEQPGDLERMASIFAHEIRGPLNSIQMAVWNINKKNKDQGLVQNITCIEQMVEEAEKIIKVLLDYSHVKPLDYKKVSISEFLEQCFSSAEKTFSSKKIKLSKDLSRIKKEKILIDPVQVKKVIRNILVNAIEAVPENKSGRIVLLAEIIKDVLSIQISDKGKGIAPDDLTRIFEPLFSKKPKGTGLGLSISRKIIDSHQGVINVDSKINEGTVVTVRIPLKPMK